MLLSAVGRAPVTEDFGLEKTNIKLDRGFIKVDAFMRTTEPNVYAIGDVVPTPDAGPRRVGARASSRWSTSPGRKPQPINYDRVPSATYCYPEVASVGLTEKKAKERGYDVKTGIFPFSAITKATHLQRGHRDGEDCLARRSTTRCWASTWWARTPPSCSPRPASRSGWRPPPRRSPAPCTRTPRCRRLSRRRAEATLGHPIHI